MLLARDTDEYTDNSNHDNNNDIDNDNSILLIM